MKSNTKNRLTNKQIQKLVKLNFGDSCETGSITELKGGMFNAIYLIERVLEKDKVILKVGVVPGTPLLTYEKDVMPTEVECFRLINEQTKVPIPNILAYDFSKKHIKSNYFFMTPLEGETLMQSMGKMSKDNLAKIRGEQAGYLAQMHQIKGSYYGYFSTNKEEQYATWKTAFLSMFDLILKDAKERNVRLPYEKIRQALSDNASYLEHLKAPALVEYDCHEGNIFVKKVGEEYHIEGIVDFERAFWGDPVADFAAAFVMADDIRKQKAFLSSYLKESKEIQKYTEEDAIRYQLYRMYLFTVMATETFRYGFLYASFQGLWAKIVVKKCLQQLDNSR